MNRLSVVITNYNYEGYVDVAIESALALRWDDVEIIVVDDGSTDGSATVIERYADRVKVLKTANGTQRVAANQGYAMTTGDVVIFLDSDDVLPADLPLRLAGVWVSSISKAQFRMQRIDSTGRAFGEPFPDFTRVPTPAHIRSWVTRTTAYPTPPGSGNAYARWFLDRLFPIGPAVGAASDSALLAAAPFFGDVVTVPEIVVGYRQHGENDSNLLKDDLRFPREVARARARWTFAQEAVKPGTKVVDERPLFRSRELLQLRVASNRVAPCERPLPGDSKLRMLMDALRSPFQVGPESLRHRLTVAGWCLATLSVPEQAARRLIRLRYGRGH